MLTSRFKNNNFMNFRYKNDKNAEINSKWVLMELLSYAIPIHSLSSYQITIQQPSSKNTASKIRLELPQKSLFSANFLTFFIFSSSMLNILMPELVVASYVF